MPYVTTSDGVELFVKDWGQGRPVVLIHGWPLSSDTWDELSLTLAENGYRAVSYDRRGFGRSDQPWHGYDYDRFADDLADVMTELDLSDATIIGFSMGGGEVARYLSRHGTQRVRQAALIGSIVPYLLKTDDNPEGAPQDVLDDIGASIRDDRAAFFQTFFRNFYGVGMISQPVSNGVIENSWRQAMMAGLHPILAAARAFGSTDLRADLAAFTVPTLIIHGTGDAIVPIDATSRAAARAIPQANLIEYDGAPHGLLAANTDEIARDVLSFLAE
jgi:pimeloyl-ACP methyl ester carboxylesterase